jgi:hypothetical protein
MVRKLKSPSRTLTRKGGKDFQGEFPCTKSTTFPLVFDSVASLHCAAYCEHRPEVKHMEFEVRGREYPDEAGTGMVKALHDYTLTLVTGELEEVEAKYSRDSLSKEEAERLEVLQRCMARDGRVLNIVFREDLEKHGFIDTVLLLRRFGTLPYPERSIKRALDRLGTFGPGTLDNWLARSGAANIPTGLLYHLLYHQRLPLLYQRLLATELVPCRV